VFFALFLGVYLTTVLGNLLILLLIRLDPHLHTPMYFFLSHLAFTDVSFSSVTVPKMLINMQNLDSFFLAVMAYDRYVAICRPLHYTLVMSPRCCILLVVMSLILAQAYSLTHTLLLAQISFCTDNIIPHFFCELLPLLKLSCSDTYANRCVLTYWGGALTILIPLLIVISYARIVAAILHIPSASGKWKAFSTCSSHLSAICLFYVSAIGVYFIPSSADSASKDRIAAVMYAVVTPMLNPFIYSLRNRDMKSALKRLLSRRALQSP
ncbi:hypothetical protein K5549_016879, partial [Capra hircus]